MRSKWSRRSVLSGASLMAGAAALAACGATPTPQVVEREVTTIVEGTPQIVKETVVVQETVVVEKEVTVEVAKEAPVTIYFWTPAGALGGEKHDAQWDPGAKVSKDEKGNEVKEYWPWIRTYQMEQTFPNVTVVTQTLGWDEHFQKLDLAMAANLPPDIVLENNTPKYARAGALLELNDIAQTIGLNPADYYPALIADYTIDGKLLAWANCTGGFAYGVNMGNVREMGAESLLPAGPNYQIPSFDRLLEILKALTFERDGKQVWGTAWVGGGGPVSQWPWMGSLVWGFGADWLCDKGRADEVCMDNEAGYAAIQFIEDAVFKYKVAPEGMATSGGNVLGDLFYRSELSLQQATVSTGLGAMAGQVKKLQEAGEAIPDLEVQLMIPPAAQGQQPGVIDDPTAFALPKTGNPNNSRWAGELLKILVSGDALEDGRPWGVSAHMETAKAQAAADPSLAFEVDYLIPIGRVRNTHPKYDEIANLWQQEIQAVLAGTKKAKEAVDSYAAAARLALQES